MMIQVQIPQIIYSYSIFFSLMQKAINQSQCLSNTFNLLSSSVFPAVRTTVQRYLVKVLKMATEDEAHSTTMRRYVQYISALGHPC